MDVENVNKTADGAGRAGAEMPGPPLSSGGRCLRRCLVVVVAAGLLGVWLSWSGLDVAVARVYFVPGASDPWPVGEQGLARGLYRYGPWVAIGWAAGGLLVGLGALAWTWGGGAGAAVGARTQAWRPGGWARAAVFFPLLMLLGPGLLVNAIGKDLWGRPRPKHLAEFGGQAQYVTAGWPNFGVANQKSFPSGHASMGFYLMAGYFVWRRRAPGWARASLVLGVGAGLAIGWARIADGGHFLSDVLWAGALVYVAGEVLAWVWLREPPLGAVGPGAGVSVRTETS